MADSPNISFNKKYNIITRIIIYFERDKIRQKYNYNTHSPLILRIAIIIALKLHLLEDYEIYVSCYYPLFCTDSLINK